jgi:acyl-CoA synthetase (AMP-forming)/AMP-acid ligase II
MYGCLYAGLVAVPVPAPEASRLRASVPRLRSIIGDCATRVLLGTAARSQLLEAARVELAGVPADGWIETSLAAAPRFPPPTSPRLDDLAYLQYTSGSTALPKGVMINHAHLARHLAAMQDALAYDETSVSVSWMPHFHDYGLIEGIFLPLFNGTPAYLMSPFGFLKRPHRLAPGDQHAPRHAHAGAELRVPLRGTPQHARRSALRWTCAACGPRAMAASRSIRPRPPSSWRRLRASGLRPEALRPAFGLAEATLMVTATPWTRPRWSLTSTRARSSTAAFSRRVRVRRHAGDRRVGPADPRHARRHRRCGHAAAPAGRPCRRGLGRVVRDRERILGSRR